ncbi:MULTISPECIES: type II toxin-antitoxin system HicA family toxin [unclassified Aureimonas]|uniref:type II toxin-antitoxin system HicA family toxin n=1 Tax=unclassified Aureimonas TaxID=2615206 RepID=UPI0006FE3A19|nr:MULTISPECIES: type II toxin-antitoxin system HicA family toxin [unclassified Aureimonas]KQT66246.1 hypothetical protein ASG62_19660 [Aureimonas sp. Leaf427]KQT72435.1 hypothetical protein ASG54_04030 [Aureimonas sp. Leaf460]
MAKFPVLSARDVVKALERSGFVVERVRGSHHKLVHPGPPKRTIVVPVHGHRDLPIGTLRAILEQSGLTEEAFRRALG